MFSGFSALASIPSSSCSSSSAAFSPMRSPSRTTGMPSSSSHGYSSVHSRTAPSRAPTVLATHHSPTLPRVPRPNLNADRVSQSLSCTMTNPASVPTSSAAAAAAASSSNAVYVDVSSTAGVDISLHGRGASAQNDDGGRFFKLRCARCRTLYAGAENAVTACRFHSGMASRSRLRGASTGRYTCCEQPIGSPGCKTAAHVEDPGFSQVMSQLQQEQATRERAQCQQAHLERLALKRLDDDDRHVHALEKAHNAGEVPPTARVHGLSWLSSAEVESELAEQPSPTGTAAAATTTNICTSNDSKTFYPSDSTQSRGCPSGSKTCPHSRDQQAAGEDKPLDSTDHRVHRVTPTDTLRRLSMMYDVSVSEICQLNELSSRHESALRARATVFIPRKANNAAPQSPPPSEASRRRSAVAWLMDAATVPTEEARFYLDANDWNTRRAYAHLKSDKEFAQRNRRFGATSASLRC
eukprot:CAMPEP_0177665194 /NCGR_PEP_ID=MMETSP0447-20121125/20916_1 /TAXON_ID=0 /ORGANISM="Stygamoeba regulata, Strain BSH-02190019" /LENGTH=467 /DNA_ID=CAMNT_0019171255 /DNA_START=154 /DNA_END=1558 /DNA_ORIENTATION=+